MTTTFASLEEFESAARRLWGEGLMARVRVERPDAAGYEVEFDPWVSLSLPPSEVKARLAEVAKAPRPAWRLAAPEIVELVRRLEARRAPGTTSLLELKFFKGQAGAWSLSTSVTKGNVPGVIPFDFGGGHWDHELPALFKKVLEQVPP